MIGGWLICLLKGKHLRGKLVSNENGKRIFACPRCGRQSAYKAKQ